MDIGPHEARLIEEYASLCNRMGKLQTILHNWDKLDFTPVCTKSQLQWQYDAMWLYRKAIEERTDFIQLQEGNQVHESE